MFFFFVHSYISTHSKLCCIVSVPCTLKQNGAQKITFCIQCVHFLLNKCYRTCLEEEKACEFRINGDVLQVVRVTLEVEPPGGVKNGVCSKA